MGIYGPHALEDLYDRYKSCEEVKRQPLDKIVILGNKTYLFNEQYRINHGNNRIKIRWCLKKELTIQSYIRICD